MCEFLPPLPLALLELELNHVIYNQRWCRLGEVQGLIAFKVPIGHVGCRERYGRRYGQGVLLLPRSSVGRGGQGGRRPSQAVGCAYHPRKVRDW